MNETRLQGAVVGCGKIAAMCHLPALQAIKDIEIMAVCDIKEEAGRETARRWGVPNVYQDFSQMLQSEKLDFVNICTPPRSHFPLSMQAIEAGLNVLLEKPMALTLNEAEVIVATAKKSKVKLCVVHNLLFSPVIQKAKALVDSGVIGEVIGMQVHIARNGLDYSQPEDWRYDLPGGLFGEYASHPVYLLQAFLGNINGIRALKKKCGASPWIATDELKVLVDAKKGLGAFSVSCSSFEESLTLEIFGSQRNLHINLLTQTMSQSQHRSGRFYDLVLDRLDLMLPIVTAAAAGTISRFRGQKLTRIGHQVIIQRFIESIRYNSEPPVRGEEGRETIRVLEEIWKQLGE